jgi:protein gp37
MKHSKIEWCHHTWNPVRGCTKVSEGCAHCYAETLSKRNPATLGEWGNGGTRIVAVPSSWNKPVRWNAEAQAAGTRARVFCASLADVFEDWQGELRFPADIAVDGFVRARWDGRQLIREFEGSAEHQGLPLATMDNLRTEQFALIEATPHLDWLLLTKRPQNVMRMVPAHWQKQFPNNVWMGTTVENQARADERIPELLQIPAKVRFLSCEPLLGEFSLYNATKVCWTIPMKYMSWKEAPASQVKWAMQSLLPAGYKPKIHWLICGGESGPEARPMHPDWARTLRDQCQAAGVPFFFKQWGDWFPVSQHPEGFVDTYCRSKLTVVHKNGSTHGHLEEGAFLEGTHAMSTYRVGKKAAGRLLDGREWNEFPIVSESEVPS